MRQAHVLPVIAAVLFALPLCLHADMLQLKDGRCFEGKVVQRDAKTVTFDVSRYGGVVTMEFPAADVVSIKVAPVKAAASRPAVVAAPVKKNAPAATLPVRPTAPPIVKYDTNTYYIIPLHGEVGKTVLASMLRESLEDALLRKPTVVVLEVNSPGGMVKEAEDIITVLRKYNDKLRIVVYSDQAISAAAILSLTVREIYFKPSGVMGAATSYIPNNLFLPEKVEAKMQSIWSATARSSAESGGHDPGLAAAMIENKADLYLVEQGKRKVTQENKPDSNAKCKIVVHKGEVLCLTASEAVEVGLGKGIAEDYAALGKLMGLEGWKECAGLGTLLAQHWADTWEKLEVDLKRINTEFLHNMEAAKRVRPEGKGYVYYQGSGNLTGKSREKWRSQALECVTNLRKAEKNLKDAIALTENLDRLKTLNEALKETLIEVSADANEMYKNSGKTNIME